MMKILKFAILGMFLSAFAEAQEVKCPKDYAKLRDNRAQRDHCYISATYSCPDKDYPEYMENDNKNVISSGGSVTMMPGFDMKDYTRNFCAKRTPKGLGGLCLPGTPGKDMLLVGGHRRELDKFCVYQKFAKPNCPAGHVVANQEIGSRKVWGFHWCRKPD